MSRTNRNGSLGSVCRALVGLVADWWRADRIRISPREGALLRLRPASLVMIAERPVEVLRRQEVQTRFAQGILYECRTEEGPVNLDVWLCANASRLEIWWSVSGRIEALLEHQIEILG